MRVCLDTNVLIKIFLPHSPFIEILGDLTNGRITLVVSNEILLEYEEVVVREFGSDRWRKIESLLNILARLHGVAEVQPHFRFGLIRDDPDDNKFTDCAIAGKADFIITYDHHFAALRDAGYQPQPLTPEEFAKHPGR
jgi:uncharacterized protein